MIIQTVTITTADNRLFVFEGCKQPTLKVIAPGMPVMLEFESALGTPLGLVVIQPGMVVKYGDQTATTSQIDDKTGMVYVGGDPDDKLPSDE